MIKPTAQAVQQTEPRSSSPVRFDMNRRTFLGGTAATAVSLLGFPLAASAEEIGPESPTARYNNAYQRRAASAIAQKVRPFIHLTNGDDEKYPTKFASYTKGLPHDSLGNVNLAAYSALINALSTGRPADFEAIPMGGTLKLSNPQSSYSYCLEGCDSHVDMIAAAPSFASNQQGSEMAECYWMAMARDVPFEGYASDPTIAAAVADLGTFPDYQGPQPVDADTIFRGSTPGDLIGPYLSQFLTLNVPYGATLVPQKIKTNAPDDDHLVAYADWLSVQNGAAPSDSNHFDPTLRYIRNLRDLAAYVHSDFSYQSGITAALILNGMRARLDPNNPYLGYSTTSPFGTLGGPDVLDMVGRVSAGALRCAYFQKWLVHRRARPEEYAGTVQNQLTGQGKYPIPARLLSSPALPALYQKYGTYLLPMAFAEGCPPHPSYPQGHATLAGATVTILKAFYDESFVIPNPMMASPDGLSLVPYSGPDLTLGNELNKLAWNIARARDGAGVHWRSDGLNGLLLGQSMAIKLLQDLKGEYWESFPGFQLTTFTGTTITI